MDQAEIARRVKGIRRVRFYLIHLEPTERWDLQGEAFPSLMAQHGAWLQELEVTGKLLLAGPIDLDDWRGRGMAVVRAPSPRAAAAIATREPFHRAGLRRNRVETWDVIEGSISLRVDLQAGRGALS